MPGNAQCAPQRSLVHERRLAQGEGEKVADRGHRADAPVRDGPMGPRRVLAEDDGSLSQPDRVAALNVPTTESSINEGCARS